MNVRILPVCVMGCIHVRRLNLGLYPHPKVFGGMESTHVNSKGKNPLYWRVRKGSKPLRCITQDSEPNTLPTELPHPQGSNYAVFSSGLRWENLLFEFSLLCIVYKLTNTSHFYAVITKPAIEEYHIINLCYNHCKRRRNVFEEVFLIQFFF